MEFPDPPRGFTAIHWRFPIWFYRLGFGWLFGSRALLLTHIGRKTGIKRQTVLEVVHKSDDTKSYTVASGFGPKSHWYQNITQTPEVSIQVGLKKMVATANFLDPDQKELIFLDYVDRYPQGFKLLANLVGYEIEHTQAGYREFARQIPMIQFTVQQAKVPNI